MIKYLDKHDFNKEEIEDLFLSVEWSSGKFPEKLVIAMKNFKTVFSAYDNDKLVGMICVMDDGIMNAYIHYLLVNPNYQKKGIGKQLVEMVKEKYKDYLRLAVIGYYKAEGFYKALGFTKSEESFPFFITSLWT